MLVALGLASLTGTLLGSPFANAVYIGHPGWKQAGGRIGYSLANGVLVLAVCVLGIVPVLLSLIPLPAVLPILLYISLLVAAQAFQTHPGRYAPAIVFAMVPHFAAWGLTLVDGALNTAGLVVRTEFAKEHPEAVAAVEERMQRPFTALVQASRDFKSHH